MKKSLFVYISYIAIITKLQQKKLNFGHVCPVGAPTQPDVFLLSTLWVAKGLGLLIAPDKRGDSQNTYIFLISPGKHMLWILLRSTSVGRFWWVTYIIMEDTFHDI